MTDPLSPAAQAVLDAFESSKFADAYALAAALRAAAEQVAPKCFVATGGDYAAGANNERIVMRNQLLAIATELEAQP